MFVDNMYRDSELRRVNVSVGILKKKKKEGEASSLVDKCPKQRATENALGYLSVKSLKLDDNVNVMHRSYNLLFN